MEEPIQQIPSPHTDTIESEELLYYISPALLKIDYADQIVEASLIVGSLIFFTFLFGLTYAVSNCFNAFRSLPRKHRVFMSLAVIRGIYGVTCIIFGTFFLFNTTNLDRDVVFGRTATSSFAVFYTVGFFTFELAAVILSDLAFKTFSKMLLTHHGLALIGYSLAARLGANHTFGCEGLILEMSTPFSCLCFVLLKAGMERSALWRANQILLVHTFHLRSVVECHIWWRTYCNWAHIWEHMPVALFTLLYVNLTLVTFLMTPYWGYRKTQQLFNPVDWNFQESRNTDHLSNGDLKKSA